jgi:hypothetical protein
VRFDLVENISRLLAKGGEQGNRTSKFVCRFCVGLKENTPQWKPTPEVAANCANLRNLRSHFSVVHFPKSNRRKTTQKQREASDHRHAENK